MILSEAIFQITVALIFLFAGPWMFGFSNLAYAGGITSNLYVVPPPPDWTGTGKEWTNTLLYEKAQLRTIIFNTFVFMQMWNEINCRRIDSRLNIFANLHRNKAFIYIFFFIVTMQIIM